MITFIGNNASGQEITDGGRLKMRLFVNLLIREGYETNVIDLNGWKYRFLKVISQIKKAIKRKDDIIIMAGPKGCRFIIPLVCKLNEKAKTRVVFCPVGIGTIDALVKNFSLEQIDDFINCRNFYGIEDEKMKGFLSSLNYVCPENGVQNKLFKTYYGLTNTVVIENFRDMDISPKNYGNPGDFKIIYASRLKEYKGILDLIEVVKDINDEKIANVHLDIFGDNQLTEENSEYFRSVLDDNIQYKGIVSSTILQSILKEYDLFCLPTQYYAEGTSGALVESMIAGTPSLVSSYSQVDALIKDNINGYIFKIGSKESLKERLLEIYKNRDKLESIGKQAQETSKKFTYIYNRSAFLHVMTGENK